MISLICLKIEAGYLELHQNWFNLTELLDECVAEYARLLFLLVWNF